MSPSPLVLAHGTAVQAAAQRSFSCLNSHSVIAALPKRRSEREVVRVQSAAVARQERCSRACPSLEPVSQMSKSLAFQYLLTPTGIARDTRVSIGGDGGH